MTTHMDRDTFLKNLVQSRLFNAQELEDVLPRLPDTTRGRVVARTLVQLGLLTKFQAELLLAGRTKGFHLSQYRILDLLGEGGMGQVYKAVHLTMNRVVALKLLAPHLVSTARARDLFQKEVRAAARLIHPNIVTAFDANHIGDRHFLVMEFVDGPNLDQLVREQGRLPVGLACEIIKQAAIGLQYAHEIGMVHRDIKPANLLVHLPAQHKDLVVKILDFGLARLNEPGQETQADAARGRIIMGTPDFLSPEQAEGGEVDIRSDLYSLGCTFYFLLARRAPFSGGTSLEKLERHKQEEPVPVEEGRSDVPPGVAGLVRRLMAKYPPHRFQTPAELAAAVAPFAVSGATPWPGPGPSAHLASKTDFALPSTGDLSSEKGLMETFPSDNAPTPHPNLGLTPWELAALDDRRTLKKLLFWAIGIVAILGGLATLLFLLLGD